MHASPVEGLKIPERDRCLRLQRYDAQDFTVMPQCSESFTLIEVDLFPGRSLDAKRSFYQAVVRRVAALGVPGANPSGRDRFAASRCPRADTPGPPIAGAPFADEKLRRIDTKRRVHGQVRRVGKV